MKLAFFSLSLFAAASSFALTDVWFGENGGVWEIDDQNRPPLFTDQNHSVRIDVNDPANYKNYNLIFNFKNWNGNEFAVKFGQTADSYTFGGMEFKGLDTGTNWNRTTCTDETMRQVDLNILGDVKYTNNYGVGDGGEKVYSQYIWLGTGLKSVTIGGSLEIENSIGWLGNNNVNRSQNFYALPKAYVGGDVVLKGEYAVFKTGVGQRRNDDGGEYPDLRMGSFDNPDLEIKGVINFGTEGGTRQWFFDNSWETSSTGMQSYMKIGGLSGNGLIASSGYTYGANTVMAFAVEAGKSYDYKGLVTVEHMDYTPMNTANMLNLEIRNAATGVQTLRLGMNGDAGFTGNVTVYSGTLFYGNADYLRKDADHNNLVMNGGNFGAAASDAPVSGLDIGDAYFNNIEWNGGKILVDIESLSSIDVIFADTLSGSADVFEFVFNYDGDWDDLAGLRISDFFNVGSLSDDQISKFLISDAYNRYYGWFEQVQGGYEFMYAAVPEPAAVAALFGALALAFAASRRRK